MVLKYSAKRKPHVTFSHLICSFLKHELAKRVFVSKPSAARNGKDHKISSPYETQYNHIIVASINPHVNFITKVVHLD
jgi:hypothetical protein